MVASPKSEATYHSKGEKKLSSFFGYLDKLSIARFMLY